MRRREIADVEVVQIAIQQEIARSHGSRYGHRLCGFLPVTGDHSCQQVAELSGEDRPALGYAVRNPRTGRDARK